MPTQTSGIIPQETEGIGGIEQLCVSYCYSVILTYKHNRTDLTYWLFIQHYYKFRLPTRSLPDVDSRKLNYC
jgi:hypothetical protein